MGRHQVLTLLVLSSLLTIVSCDQSSTDKGDSDTKQENIDVPLFLELHALKQSLTPLFSAVFSGKQSLQHVKKSQDVTVRVGGGNQQFSLATEGLTVSKLSEEEFILSLHGVSSSLQATVARAKLICEVLKCTEDDKSKMDGWVKDHSTRVDKSLIVMLDSQEQRVELHLRNSHDSQLPYRLFADIYFLVPKNPAMSEK